MNERLLARALFVLGMGTLSLMLLFGQRWSEVGALGRVGFAVAFVAASVAIALDFKHRREDKGAQGATGGGSV